MLQKVLSKSENECTVRTSKIHRVSQWTRAQWRLNCFSFFYGGNLPRNLPIDNGEVIDKQLAWRESGVATEQESRLERPRSGRTQYTEINQERKVPNKPSLCLQIANNRLTPIWKSIKISKSFLENCKNSWLYKRGRKNVMPEELFLRWMVCEWHRFKGSCNLLRRWFTLFIRGLKNVAVQNSLDILDVPKDGQTEKIWQLADFWVYIVSWSSRHLALPSV